MVHITNYACCREGVYKIGTFFKLPFWVHRQRPIDRQIWWPRDLDLWPLNINLTWPITLVMRNQCTMWTFCDFVSELGGGQTRSHGQTPQRLMISLIMGRCIILVVINLKHCGIDPKLLTSAHWIDHPGVLILTLGEGVTDAKLSCQHSARNLGFIFWSAFIHQKVDIITK